QSGGAAHRLSRTVVRHFRQQRSARAGVPLASWRSHAESRSLRSVAPATLAIPHCVPEVLVLARRWFFLARQSFSSVAKGSPREMRCASPLTLSSVFWACLP